MQITYTNGALQLLYFLQRHSGWQSIKRSEYKHAERLETFRDIEIIRHANPALWQVRLAQSNGMPQEHCREYDNQVDARTPGLLGSFMKPANAKPDVERWLAGEISTSRMIHNSSLESCYAQASDCICGIWQVFRENAYALDAELQRRIKIAAEFKTMAESGDTERTTKDDISLQSTRIAALQEARSLLRIHLLGSLDRTEAAGR